MAKQNVRDIPIMNVNEVNKKTSTILYGVSQEFLDTNSKEISRIRDTVKRISLKNNYVTGSNPIDFLTKMAYNEKDNKRAALSKLPKDNKGKVDLNKFLNGMTLGQINEIYAQEQDRISLYEDYRAIVKYIPQIAQAINVWRDNIISPDDFTKDIFNVIYDDDKNEDLKSKVEKNIDRLNTRYAIEDKIDEWVTNALALGDEFVAVLKLEDEFNRIFQEGGDIKILDESSVLSEDTIMISESQIIELQSLFSECMNNKYNGNLSEEEKIIQESKFIKGVKNEIADILNQNIHFSTNPNILMEDDLSIVEQFRREASNKVKVSKDGININNQGTMEGSVRRGKKNDRLYINGSYLKTLEPERVIKIKVGEVVYGYFYVEVRGKNDIIRPKNVYSALTLRQTVDLSSSDISMIDDPKTRLITDLFAKNISKKIDREFLANNKEFKLIIYELLKKDYIYNNNIQITYFEPNTVKHLMTKERKDGYGESVLSDVIFTAKLYLSVLVTTLLNKLYRSQDHRTFYIETGLSEDVEGIVNAFIRDVATKDVKISDTQSIDSIFNTIGSCSNFYIPTVNGERAVDIDVTSGLNIEMDNDFMEYLKKTMISGMGIPASMLNYADELEFARSVSMQNGMFLRAVVVKQKKLTTPFSSMYQSLYENEYGTSVLTSTEQSELEERRKKYTSFTDSEKVKSSDNEKTEYVDIELIKAQFPSPSSLNATNLADQISTAQNIIQLIVENKFGSGEIDELHKAKFVNELNKKYVPNVDWDDIEDIFNSTRIDAMEEKIKNNITTEQDSSGENGEEDIGY